MLGVPPGIRAVDTIVVSGVERADWPTPAQVMERYPNATIVGLDRVVFRMQRNDYRIVARIFYPGCMVYIRFVGTHKDYNHIKAEEV